MASEIQPDRGNNPACQHLGAGVEIAAAERIGWKHSIIRSSDSPTSRVGFCCGLHGGFCLWG